MGNGCLACRPRQAGAAWNKSAENLICTLAIRDPRQRAAINDFIGGLAQRAAEEGRAVAILRESPPQKRPTMRPTFRPTWTVARPASHLIRLQISRVRRFPGAPFAYKTTNIVGRSLTACNGGGQYCLVAHDPDFVVIDLNVGDDRSQVGLASLRIT